MKLSIDNIITVADNNDMHVNTYIMEAWQNDTNLQEQKAYII